MISSIIVRLLPTGDILDRLNDLWSRYHKALNFASEVAFKEKIWGLYKLQTRLYSEIRTKFDLPSKAAVAVLNQVVMQYSNQQWRQTLSVFKPGSAIFVVRHWYRRDGLVNIYGIHIPFKSNSNNLSHDHQAQLVHTNGKWLLHQAVPCDVPVISDVKDFVGVDLGIINIATDSDGRIYSSAQLRGVRYRYERMRSRLQSVGTHSAKRLLKRRAGKQRRFVRNNNHIVSKSIVATAKDTMRGISLEDLSGIQHRVTVNEPKSSKRSAVCKWSFGELRKYIQYKSELYGVLCVVVNPYKTSQTCPECGHASKLNRISVSKFQCQVCGHSGHADHIAALNIRSRAVRNQPNATLPIVVASQKQFRKNMGLTTSISKRYYPCQSQD